MINEDYQPAWTEFNVADDSVPQSLGEFKNLDEVNKFLRDNVVAINHSITVQRHMDANEKRLVRENYQEVLEDTLPKLERDYAVHLSVLNEAKRNEKEASEMVNAAITEAKLLAKEAKIGLKEIKLDDITTFRIPNENKYYFYTYIDKQLKLCAVREIPDMEKRELWNSGVNNSKLFSDGKTTTQEGTEE